MSCGGKGAGMGQHERVIGATATRWRTSKAALRLRLSLLLVVADLTVICICYPLANLLRHNNFTEASGMLMLATSIPLYLLCAAVTRAYSPIVVIRRGSSIGRALQAVLMASVLQIFLFYLLHSGSSFSRAVLGLGLLFIAIALGVLRAVYGSWVNRVLGGTPYDTIVIHDGRSIMPVRSPEATLIVDPGSNLDPSRPSPQVFDRLARTVGHSDRVIVYCPADRRLAWASALKGVNVQAEVVAEELCGIDPLGVGRHDDTPTFIVARGPLDAVNRLMKRGFDLAFGGMALLLIAPVMVAVAIAIRLDSSGPILFAQTRIGYRNQLFRIYKFRSMYTNLSDHGGVRSTERDDPRITRIGRFIRRTSIDELPQLLNVVRGDMSIVGPRPHALDSTAEDALFWEVDARYWHRHACKPGLTGLAQVRGHRGATHQKSDLTNRLVSDLEYLNGWTLWRDVLIIGRTVMVVLHPNAY